MKLTMLGTGHAMVTECYNTCFLMEDEKDGQKDYFLVDAGGGNTILKRLKQINVKLSDIRHIFVTHKHIDHILGIIWIVRFITQKMASGAIEGDYYIYGHDEVIKIINNLAQTLLQKKTLPFIGTRLHLVELKDGEEFVVLGRKCTAFDIHSTKAKQFGFCLDYADGKKLTCCGDEPYNENIKEYALNADYLMHEAFCLYDEREKYKPYEKHHSTAKDAGELAQSLNVKNLIVYHTEDDHIKQRRELYTKEAKLSFEGNVLVPDDLEVIDLV